MTSYHRPVPERDESTFFRWLGRQVGHVRQAVATPPPVYRQERVEERPHPADPSLVLRRTTIDEARKTPPPAEAVARRP